MSSNFDTFLQNNENFANSLNHEEFAKQHSTHTPRFLWIGCADARVEPHAILGYNIGEVFTHRNVGNVINPNDANINAVITYAVQYLNIRDIIVAGHTDCGAMKASLSPEYFDGMEEWLSPIRTLATDTAHHYNTTDFNAIDIHALTTNANNTVKIPAVSSHPHDILSCFNVHKQIDNLKQLPSVKKVQEKITIRGVLYHTERGTLHTISVS